MQRMMLAALLLLLGYCPSGAVGFQWATAPDPGNAPLQVAIWYPSVSATASQLVGPFDMDVALNGNEPGGNHPLIVMSHGTGGMALNSFDTAIALAEAGFVVVSVTHTGDNYRDQSVAFTRQNFVDRPRHISRVIDFMVEKWSGHAAIDTARIGIFGHSAGGATALIVAGGIADMTQLVAFCQASPDDWGCKRGRLRGMSATETIATPVAARDTRIRAVVLAAPAVVAAFRPAGLSAISVPVQLWVGAEDDIVRDGSSVRAMLPAPPDYHLVSGGGHFAFLSPCSAILQSAAPEICANPAGFDRTAFLRGFQKAVIAFYQSSLR